MREELKEIIQKSSLSDSQKSKWMIFLGFAGPEVAKDILEVVKSNLQELEFLTRNLEAKIKAIDNPDREEWNKIIKEEKEYLQKEAQSQ